jgi:septum site-determining protein MinD
VLEILAVELIGIIPEDESVLISTNRGRPVAIDDKSQAGLAFRNIARRLLGEDVPFQTLRGQSNIFQRFFRMIHSDGRQG